MSTLISPQSVQRNGFMKPVRISSRFLQIVTAFVLLGLPSACAAPESTPGSVPDSSAAQESSSEEGTHEFVVESSAYLDGDEIPTRFTCEGEDLSPPIAWNGVPEDAISFALIMEDPDAPIGTWVHWVVYNLPAETIDLSAGVGSGPGLPDGALHGRNDWGDAAYGGPCPPGGTHRYFIYVFALDTVLDLPAGASSADVRDTMKGHILGQAQLMGKYSR